MLMWKTTLLVQLPIEFQSNSLAAITKITTIAAQNSAMGILWEIRDTLWLFCSAVVKFLISSIVAETLEHYI